jgi:hypothetical protein
MRDIRVKFNRHGAKKLKGDEHEQAKPPILLHKSQRPYALAEKIMASLEK